MKVLRLLGNILIGIILFGLILSLSFVKSTKNFLEKDLILGVVKAGITETLNKEADNVKEETQEMFKEIFNDNQVGEVVSVVINNFKDYQKDSTNFHISDNDIDKIYNFAMKYKTQIIKISGENISEITDEQFKEMFSSENVNKFANKIFSEVSGDIGDEVDKVIDIYNEATSSKVTVILIVSIVFFIIILGLINWSFYKWMIVVGIDLILTGLILAFVYGAGTMLNDIISAEKIIKETIGEINFTGYAILGGIEVVVGIILIIVYNVIDSRTLNQQIRDLGTGN